MFAPKLTSQPIEKCFHYWKNKIKNGIEPLDGLY